MVTAMERSISPYEERGSEVNMADSLGIKDAAKEPAWQEPAWMLEAKIAATSRLEAKIAGFKPMADNDNVFTCDEVADWLRTLSRISNCQSLYWCAGEYAQRIVVDEELTRGEHWLWFRDDKAFWLRRIGMTEEEYEVLERFGIDRGTDVSPSEGAGVATLEAQMISLQKTQDGTGKTQMHMVQMELDLRELQKEVDDMRAGAETLEALKQGHYHYAEDDGTLEALKQGAGDYELQKRVDEMRELQKLIDDLRAGDKTLEALSLPHYELQQMVDEMREMCADGSVTEVVVVLGYWRSK